MNNENPSRGVILCYIVERKNIRLGILIMFRKNLHKMTYHVRGFMAFGPNDRCYVLNHGIVCDVVPILCMCVDIGMENNVAGGSSPSLSHGKALFHFPSAKNGSFCEVTTKMPFHNATVPFS